MSRQHHPYGGRPPNEGPMSLREQNMYNALQRALAENERLKQSSREENARFITDIARLQVRNAHLEREQRENDNTALSVEEAAALWTASEQVTTPTSWTLLKYSRNLQDHLSSAYMDAARLRARNRELEIEHSQKSHADLLRDEAAKVLRQLYSDLEGITEASIQRGSEPDNMDHIKEAVDRLALVWFDSDANDKIHEILLDQFKDLRHNEQQGERKTDHVEKLGLILTACETKCKGLPQYGGAIGESQPNLNDFLQHCERILARWAK